MNILSENIKTFLTLLCSAGTEQNQDTYCACICSMIFSYTVKNFPQLLILSALYVPSQAVICSPPWLAVREGLNLKYIYIYGVPKQPEMNHTLTDDGDDLIIWSFNLKFHKVYRPLPWLIIESMKFYFTLPPCSSSNVQLHK